VLAHGPLVLVSAQQSAACADYLFDGIYVHLCDFMLAYLTLGICVLLLIDQQVLRLAAVVTLLTCVAGLVMWCADSLLCKLVAASGLLTDSMSAWNAHCQLCSW